MFDFANERRRAGLELAQLGFVEAIAGDPSTRPPTLPWFAGQWQRRPASATVIGNRLRSVAPVMGNRTTTVPCLQLIVEASVSAPLGCGLSLPFGARAPSSLEEVVDTEHPAARLPNGVLMTFLRLTQPPIESRHRRQAMGTRLRFTDRNTLDGYLPPSIHQNATVLVVHDLSLDVPDAQPLGVAAGLNLASWMAWSLETAEEMPG